MKRFVLSKTAERDLVEIKRYLIQKAGPRITHTVIKDIRSALCLLGSRPGVGHVRTDLTSHPVKFWPVYSYLIVYDPGSKPVQIIRLLHGMRDVKNLLT
jgi:toxin ParE1/3/4